MVSVGRRGRLVRAVEGHRPHLDLSFRRIKEKRDYRTLSGHTALADIGLQFGDDDHLEERFLLPAYDRYLKAGGGIDGIIAANLNKIASATPESKWKEAVLSAGYDWKERYRVDVSYMRMWEETLFSSEGYRIPAVTLGWTLSEEPLLQRSFRPGGRACRWERPGPGPTHSFLCSMISAAGMGPTPLPSDFYHRRFHRRPSPGLEHLRLLPGRPDFVGHVRVLVCQ